MEVTGVLAAYDLPDLLAARAPRPAVVADVIDATGMAALVGAKEARDAYAFTAQRYAAGQGHGQGKEAFKVCSTCCCQGQWTTTQCSPPISSMGNARHPPNATASAASSIVLVVGMCRSINRDQ
jgi:hypothetical protein